MTSLGLRVGVLLGLAYLAQTVAAGEDFTLTAGDKTFRSAEARGRFVALHFLLPDQCPYCTKLVSEYSEGSPSVAGVVHVFIKPDSAEAAGALAKAAKAGDDVTIYLDSDAKVAKQFKIPDGYEFHGRATRFPALVLLGPDGNEVFRHVGKDNTDRLPFDRFAAEVDRAQRSASVQQYHLGEASLALMGFDAVAYLDDGRAEAGKTELSSRYRGVVYRFANAGNRRKFATNPDKYLPAYGGWCATAMAEGRKVEIDPTNFRVTGGRLFLFYKGWLGDAQKDWSKDEKNLAAKADAQWRKIAPGDVPAAQ
ncbi:MAG: YHS domain-containing (seleno)protein [Phycisphaerae bacterium]